MRIRLAQQGEVGPGGGPAGDLYVEIHERPHDIFSRKGDDLHCRVTVPMTAAALGTRITIKALDSEETVDVEPGTQPGASLRIRGKGVPHLRGTGRGDLHVHLDVRTPTKLDRRRRSACCASSPGPGARRSPSCPASRAASCPSCATPSTARLER